MVAAVTMDGTSDQQNGAPCGGTEVPMESTREVLKAWEMVGESDGGKFLAVR